MPSDKVNIGLVISGKDKTTILGRVHFVSYRKVVRNFGEGVYSLHLVPQSAPNVAERINPQAFEIRGFVVERSSRWLSD